LKRKQNLGEHYIPELFQNVQEIVRYDRYGPDEEQEFRSIYNLDVVVIPTNMPVIRVDHPTACTRMKEASLMLL